MKPLSWTRIGSYAAIYFVVGTALGTVLTVSHLSGGGAIDVSFARNNLIAAFAATLFVSTVIGYVQLARPIAHAAIAYGIAACGALAIIALLAGTEYGYFQAIIEDTLALPVVALGTGIGAVLRRAIRTRHSVDTQSSS